MAGPCLCINITRCVRLVAVASILFGIGVTAVSSWILHRSVQSRKSPTLDTAREFVSQVNTFFGGTTGLYDLDVIFRILISCSAAGLAGGGLQFLMSFWLLLASVHGGRILARIWVIVHIVIALTVGGACLCLLTNELEMNLPLRIFVISCGVDFLFIIFFCYVVYSYSYRNISTHGHGHDSSAFRGGDEQLEELNNPKNKQRNLSSPSSIASGPTHLTNSNVSKSQSHFAHTNPMIVNELIKANGIRFGEQGKKESNGYPPSTLI